MTPDQAAELTEQIRLEGALLAPGAIEAMAEFVAADLPALEQEIEVGLVGFMRTGLALFAIRDRGLYTETHGTFEDYCRERWGFTDRRARQLIDAAMTGTMVPVANERQARALAPVADSPADTAAAWETANEKADAEGRTVTARDLSDAVDGILAQSQPVAPAPPADDADPDAPSSASGSAPITITKTTTEKTVIDGDTGEILEQSDVDRHPAKPTPDMAAIVPDEASFRVTVSDAVVKAGKLLDLDPKKVAEVIELDDRRMYLSLAGDMARWSRLLTEALSVTNLRRVK